MSLSLLSAYSSSDEENSEDGEGSEDGKKLTERPRKSPAHETTTSRAATTDTHLVDTDLVDTEGGTDLFGPTLYTGTEAAGRDTQLAQHSLVPGKVASHLENGSNCDYKHRKRKKRRNKESDTIVYGPHLPQEEAVGSLTESGRSPLAESYGPAPAVPLTGPIEPVVDAAAESDISPAEPLEGQLYSYPVYHEQDRYYTESRREPSPLPPGDEPAGAGDEVEFFPGMGTREFKRLKSAVWTDVTTTGSVDKPDLELTFNTPLRFEPKISPGSLQTAEGYVSSEQTRGEGREQTRGEGCEQTRGEGSEQARGEGDDWGGYSEEEYYNYYVQQYQQYIQYYQQGAVSDPSGADLNKQYSLWFSQYSGPGGSGPAGSSPFLPPTLAPDIKQKSYEELLEQDRQLNEYLGTAPCEYRIQRAAFKSTFRGTKTYRENNKEFNPNHFNQLTKGARNVKKLFEKMAPSVVVDKDRYIPERELPENWEPKSNKQKKKEAWRTKMKLMVAKKS